ncbi:MAG TPA: hypothetical protein VND94_19410 [Terriglobia bacterium]|nr:hypothetical protein [Terriglobia bacterium]
MADLSHNDCRRPDYLLLLPTIVLGLATKSLNVMLIELSVAWRHGVEKADRAIPSMIGGGGVPGERTRACYRSGT